MTDEDRDRDTQRQRMASYLGLDPGAPETWPVRKLDDLIALEKQKGHDALTFEIHRLMCQR